MRLAFVVYTSFSQALWKKRSIIRIFYSPPPSFLPLAVHVSKIIIAHSYSKKVNNMNNFMEKCTYGKKELIKAIAEIFC